MADDTKVTKKGNPIALALGQDEDGTFFLLDGDERCWEGEHSREAAEKIAVGLSDLLAQGIDLEEMAPSKLSRLVDRWSRPTRSPKEK
jgi:hypothetical protein